MTREVIHQEDLWAYRDFESATLYTDGKLSLKRINGEIEEQEWYKEESGNYWLSIKRKNFKSLVKQIIRDDY